MSAALPLFLLLAASQPALPAQTADVSYRVKRGDTLFDLAADYFIQPLDYRIVQRLNRVGDPRRLRVDRQLRIPRRLLRTVTVKGEIAAFRGDVSIISAGRQNTATLGSAVPEGAIVVTGAKAFVTMALPDGSRVSLPSNSRVGISRLRQILLTREVERAFKLESGRSQWDVSKAKSRNDIFRVSTPVATAAVRGTSFRVTYDEAAGKSTVSVVEGAVAVADAAEAENALVRAGSGIALIPGIHSVETPLAAAPVLERPGKVQKSDRIDFQAAPVSNAKAYVFELASDAGFVDQIDEQLCPEPVASFDSLPNGTYFIRTSILDANGVQGMANTYGFERRLNKISLETPEPSGFGTHTGYRFRWRGEGSGDVLYRFILSRDEAAKDRVIDQSGLQKPDIAVTDLASGVYYWQIWSIRFENGKFVDTVTTPQKLQIGIIE